MLMAVNQKSKLLHRIRMIQPITKSKIKKDTSKSKESKEDSKDQQDNAAKDSED